MKRSIAIARQSENPQGILGRIIAFIMSFETKGMNQIGLDLLEIQPNDKILEVGFGQGKAISKGCALIENGMFAGLDSDLTLMLNNPSPQGYIRFFPKMRYPQC